jgi:hypothetical protein
MLNESDIRDHMEVTDSAGAHVGTVDHVEGGRIKLARRDSADGQHHYLATSDVERVEGDRLVLKQGVNAAAGPDAGAAGSNATMSDAQIAAASEYHTGSASPLGGASETPLFGTSGTGTGMGGSGKGEH